MAEQGAPAPPSKYIRFGTCVAWRRGFRKATMNKEGTELTVFCENRTDPLQPDKFTKETTCVGVNPQHADSIMEFVFKSMENPDTFNGLWKPEWTMVKKPNEIDDL
jgi:hypothetical protein